MPLEKQELLRLEEKANKLRNLTLNTTYWAGSGHIGGSCSSMDILTVLYYKMMKLDNAKPDWEDRDRFIVSKGHIGIALAPILVDRGLIEEEELKTFNLTGSRLGIHLDASKISGVDASTGSLGHGLSLAVGTALATRVLGKDYMTYCLLGDGECDEGSVWEAAMSAAQFKVNNLVTIVDRNMCMMDNNTENEMKLEPFADKWRAFGFDVYEIDGHDMNALYDVFTNAINNKTDKPVCIIAKTIKGCGIDFMENDYRWHYGALDEPKYNAAVASLKKSYEKRVAQANKK